MKTFPNCWNRIQSRLKDLVLASPFKAFVASALTITLTTCRLEFQWVRQNHSYVMSRMLSPFKIKVISIFHQYSLMRGSCENTYVPSVRELIYYPFCQTPVSLRQEEHSDAPVAHFSPWAETAWGILSSTATWKDSLWERKESAHFR